MPWIWSKWQYFRPWARHVNTVSDLVEFLWLPIVYGNVCICKLRGTPREQQTMLKL